MDFFDKLGAAAGDIAGFACEKGEKAAKYAKLNGRITKYSYDMEKSFAALGKLYYSEHKDNGAFVAENSVGEILSKIKRLENDIAEAKAEIENLRNK